MYTFFVGVGVHVQGVGDMRELDHSDLENGAVRSGGCKANL